MAQGSDGQGYDVVIVGGGVIGCAVAYFLLGPCAFDGTVAVIEPDPSYATGSTGRSAGGIRQQFSLPENIQLSLYGAEFVRAAPALLAHEGDVPALGFKENGYLFLASEEGLSALHDNQAVQAAQGAAILALDREGLSHRFPWLSLHGLAGGCFGTAHEGWLDPHALLQAFRRKARGLGATVRQDRVVDMKRGRDGRIVSVGLEGGDSLPCGQVVNAAGAAAGRVAAMAGIDLPVVPKKRQIFSFDCREAPDGVPLTVDSSGLYFRPEGGGFICGKSPEPDADPECWDFDVDYTLFEEVLWPLLAARVPAFEAIKMGAAWAGHYEVNLLDDNAVIGPHPEISNFHFANGFSGHGLQQAPGAGRAVAEMITRGAFQTLDLTRFGFERVLQKRPLFERGIV